ncbi:hypothetical protein DPV78_008622 [Talaromyces pinophilus]|nr:hypothetical protein DPV78_008622 [Talaromyces pinophilus]
MLPEQLIDREREATLAAIGYAMECVALAIGQAISSVAPEIPTTYEKAAFYIFILPSLTALWAYGFWLWWRHSVKLSNTQRAASLLFAFSLVTIAMICWVIHPTPKFGYTEFLVCIFWPTNLECIMGLLVPLRFIKREDLRDTHVDQTTEKV